MTNSNWRERFLELAAAVQQQLGYPAQSFANDPTLPIQFAFSVDGVKFDAVHLPEGEMGTHQLLLKCSVRAVDPNGDSHALQMALQANQSLARTCSGVLALDPVTQELVIGMKQSIDALNVDDLCAGAHHIASLVNHLRSVHQPYAH